MVGNKVFLSITMLLVDLVAASAGMDLPDKGITLLGEAAWDAVAAPRITVVCWAASFFLSSGLRA